MTLSCAVLRMTAAYAESKNDDEFYGAHQPDAGDSELLSDWQSKQLKCNKHPYMAGNG